MYAGRYAPLIEPIEGAGRIALRLEAEDWLTARNMGHQVAEDWIRSKRNPDAGLGPERVAELVAGENLVGPRQEKFQGTEWQLLQLDLASVLAQSHSGQYYVRVLRHSFGSGHSEKFAGPAATVRRPSGRHRGRQAKHGYFGFLAWFESASHAGELVAR